MTASNQPIIWDYDLGDTDLAATQSKAFDQPWALSRLLQHHSFYEVINIVPFSVLHRFWPRIKPTLLSKSLRDAYEYYINKVVSVAR